MRFEHITDCVERDRPPNSDSSMAALEDAFNNLGGSMKVSDVLKYRSSEGWELVAVSPLKQSDAFDLFWKRPVE